MKVGQNRFKESRSGRRLLAARNRVVADRFPRRRRVFDTDIASEFINMMMAQRNES